MRPILAYIGLVLLWSALIAVALVTWGCAAQQPGWLDWWHADESIPAPSLGEEIDPPSSFIELEPGFDLPPLEWDE